MDTANINSTLGTSKRGKCPIYPWLLGRSVPGKAFFSEKTLGIPTWYIPGIRRIYPWPRKSILLREDSRNSYLVYPRYSSDISLAPEKAGPGSNRMITRLLPARKKTPEENPQSGGVDLVIKMLIFTVKTTYSAIICTTPQEPTFVPQRMLFFDGFEGWFVG